MSNIYVISDTHFGHSNILKFKDDEGNHFRGDVFKDVSDMDEYMIRQWNSVVKPMDKVYHLGDVYFGRQDYADNILSRLNGHKRLILGNHDKGKDTVLLKHFDKIMLWRVFSEYSLLLSHVPQSLDVLKFRDREFRNVHGHIHQRILPNKRYINVSVEVIGYKPVLLKDL